MSEPAVPSLALTQAPTRVVSLVPSDTYTLAALGLGHTLVGRTQYCVHPLDAVRDVPVFGGTKNIDVDALARSMPDLVIANQEENRRSDIEAIESLGIPILLSFPKTVLEGIDHMARIADLFPDAASQTAPIIRSARETYRRLAAREQRAVPTFVPIWMDPLMTVHANTFISDVLELAGGRNVFGDRDRRYPLSADLGQREALAPEVVSERDTRYPRIRLEEVTERRPELILLPDEPHEFSLADAGVFRQLDIPAATRRLDDGDDAVRFCDGKDLMWYGLRSVEGLQRLTRIIDDARGGESTSFATPEW